MASVSTIRLVARLLDPHSPIDSTAKTPLIQKKNMRRFSKDFPVADECITSLELSQDQLSSLRAQVQNALSHAMVERASAQTSQETPRWKERGQLEGLSAYDRVHDLAPRMTTSRVNGRVDSSHLEIARFFKSDTREQYFNVQKRLFPDTIDAAVLHTVSESPHLPSESEAIKWVVYRPSWRRRLVDTCVFESAGTGLDSNGRLYFYCVTIPTPFVESPILATTKKIKRVHYRSVMISTPSVDDESCSDVFMWMRCDLKDRSTSRAFYKGLLAGLRTVGASKYKVPQFALCNGKWVQPSLQRVCGSCSLEFSLLRSKHECTLCDELICHKCILRGKSLLSPRRGSVDKSPREIKVCKPCIQRLCEEGSTDTMPLSGEFAPYDVVTPTPNHVRMGEATSESICVEWLTTPPVKKESQALEPEDLSSYPSQSCVSALTPQSDYSRWSMGTHEEATPRLVQHREFEQEDDLYASGKSVLFTVDTNEMTRVSLSEALDQWDKTPSSISSSIRSSLREQNKLLRQLQEAATESFHVRRNS